MRGASFGLTAFIVVGLAPAWCAAEPRITFEQATVVIDKVTPGAQVAWLSVARESLEYWRVSVVRRDGIALDSDRDGTVQIELDQGVPPASVWIAFDMATGGFVAGAPEGLELRPIASSVADLRHATSGLMDLMAADHELVEVLLVRPGAGAWGLTVGDGGASDADGKRDGGIAVLAGAMKPVGVSASAPAALRAGDAVALIDTQTLQYTVAAMPTGAK